MALTKDAAEKFKEFLDGKTNMYVRLSVIREGSTGFAYDLKLDDAPLSDRDLTDSTSGFMLVVDTKSSFYLDGATIDWVSGSGATSGFKFDNPNAINK